MIISLLERIASLQINEDNPNFFYGMLPSYRRHKYIPGSKRKDNNIFFTASLLLVLQRTKPLLTAMEVLLVNTIEKKALSAYERFVKHKDGRLYNFYPMSPQSHFNNGHILSRIKRFELSCDADTTCLAYMTREEQDDLWLRDVLMKQADQSGRSSNFLPRGYDLRHVYTTWIGTRHMPAEYSIVVIANILTWVLTKRLPWSVHEEASLKFILQAVVSKDYLTKPFQTSIHYPKPSIIVYHLARLVASLPESMQEPLKTALLQDLITAPALSYGYGMDRVLTDISKMKLGEHPLPFNLPTDKEVETFSFFIASFLSYVHSKKLQHLAKHPAFSMSYSCEGFNLGLIIEDAALRRKNESYRQ